MKDQRLNFDEATAVRMLAELLQLGWEKQLDTLAVVVMVYVEKIAKEATHADRVLIAGLKDGRDG